MSVPAGTAQRQSQLAALACAAAALLGSESNPYINK